MWKIQFGCGGNQIDGWENYDMDIDISKPLPRGTELYDYVFAEHVVEHVNSPDAFRFFEECYRILKPGGVLRIALPSITQVYEHADQQYLSWLKDNKYSDGTRRGAIRNIVVNHEHLSSWNYELLDLLIYAAGFDNRKRCQVGKSDHSELDNIEGHGKEIGDRNNLIETIVIEAIK